jgi:hypothetical protein
VYPTRATALRAPQKRDGLRRACYRTLRSLPLPNSSKTLPPLPLTNVCGLGGATLTGWVSQYRSNDAPSILGSPLTWRARNLPLWTRASTSALGTSRMRSTTASARYSTAVDAVNETAIVYAAFRFMPVRDEMNV